MQVRPLCLTTRRLVIANLHSLHSGSACHGLLRGCRAGEICIHFYSVICSVLAASIRA